MRRLLFVWMAVIIFSCDERETTVTSRDVKFSLAAPGSPAGGRTASVANPKSVLVTVVDDDGDVVAERKELALFQFGGAYVSGPLSLLTTGNSGYRLTEFFVVDTENKVSFATPREGSELAYLVDDPLDIAFAVGKDDVTTVTPEVLAVTSKTDPQDFGYAQFGFEAVATLQANVAVFESSADSLAFMSAALTVEGLRDSTGSDSTWTHTFQLKAATNALVLRSAPFYRLSVSKEGFAPYSEVFGAAEMNHVAIVLKPAAADTVTFTSIGLQLRYFGKPEDMVVSLQIRNAEGDSILTQSFRQMLIPSDGSIALPYHIPPVTLQKGKKYRIYVMTELSVVTPPTPGNPPPPIPSVFWVGSNGVDSYRFGNSSMDGDFYFETITANGKVDQRNAGTGTGMLLPPAFVSWQEFVVGAQ